MQNTGIDRFSNYYA